MTIEISADDGKRLQEIVEAGEYDSVESYIHAFLAGLSGEFDEHADAHIEEGIAQLERGERRTPAQLKQNLAARRAGWLAAQDAS